jgi:hypothetical protein
MSYGVNDEYYTLSRRIEARHGKFDESLAWQINNSYGAFASLGNASASRLTEIYLGFVS